MISVPRVQLVQGAAGSSQANPGIQLLQVFLDPKGDSGCPHCQRLHLRALLKAGGQLLGADSRELVELDIHHPQGHHVWKRSCQALGPFVTDAIVVQAQP